MSLNRRSSSSGRSGIPKPPPPPPVRSYIHAKKKTPEPSFKMHTGPTISYTSGSTVSKNKPNFLFDIENDKAYSYEELLDMSRKEINAIEKNNDIIRAKIKEIKKQSQQTRGGKRRRKSKRTRRHKRS